MIDNRFLVSLDFARNSVTDFFATQTFLIIIIVTLIVRWIVAKRLKKKLKQKYILWYENENNIENKKFYIDYYKKNQYIDIATFFLIASLLFVYLLTKDKIIGTVLAVWIWAILLTFQTFIVSFFTYFLLVSNYRIGDTIKIWKDNIQWEILYIKSLYTGISGKNNFGENTGDFFVIPNNYFQTHPITKTDLSIDGYQKISLYIPYHKEDYPMSFESFIDFLKPYLNTILPLRNASNVANFKTYIWSRYKIDFEYDKEWYVIIRLWFIAKRNKAPEIKSKIINFIEQLKTNQPKEL